MGEQGLPPSNFSKTLSEALTFQLHLLHFVNVAFLTTHTLISLAIYSAITAAIIYADGIKDSNIIEYLSASKASVGFFSGFLGFSLVFRTNICYNRWWEGRCLWGALIFAAINLAQQGQCWIKDKQSLRALCCAIVTFPYACKAQLRGASIMEDGEYLLQRGLLNSDQLAIVTKRDGWQPYYFMGAMRAAINIDLEKSKAASRNKFSFKSETTDSQILIFENSLTTLATSIGGLIRVKSTGLPAAYDLLFSIIFSIFFLIATLAWAPTLGWYTPIIIGVLRFTVKLIIVIGSELEDPFGDDVTDLPMHKFCEAIETQIEAIFRDAFPADSLCREWPTSVVDEAPSKEDIATPYDKHSGFPPEMMNGSTAKGSFGPKGTWMHTSRRHSDEEDEEGPMRRHANKAKGVHRGHRHRVDEVDVENDEIHSGDIGGTVYSTSTSSSFSVGEEDETDEEETDEERRIYDKRKDEEQRQLRRRGRSAGATAGKKKKRTPGNKKLTVSHGSDDMFSFSADEDLLAETILTHQNKRDKKRSGAEKKSRASSHNSSFDQRKKRVRNKQSGMSIEW
eukprot:CAMPEP_0201676062 /NCGR_PEP_ID=MMETSP0494-20130426/40989_1 /ASSEMBLY_ACC=CAM_ASM_000839 /TAXON_ID=420259 /ORGANISM="Thalassiosira gravida, Strain GMp14c1" /LENGTH=564 /DNA_ID=CAMNT_0048158683 /DNA_START=28 /DNA_END=1722 /DNA_ORIENTATION=-